LCAAISRGDQPMIDLLCSYGAASAMHLLAHYGDIRTAAAVLAANPALADDPQALDSAAGQGHESFVRLMLHYQPDLPRRVGTRAKTRPLNELLFAHGMNPSHPDWLLVTPLHRLAQSGDLETAALFLDHGADLYARDEHLGSTPLAWAAKYGKALMVRLLLRRGAPVKLADDPSWATPLAWATRRGHAEIVRLLQQFETDGTLPNPTLEPYEATATDLVAACRSGDAAARQRLADLFHLTPVPSADEIRGRVRTLLNRYAPTRPDRLAADDLGLEDARLLVARINGFETWPQLTTHIDALSL
jgi:ankyrin repeat protein